jgi:predicted Rossmann fold nucleotide-binding protein DprA/Smf involved in DNA uptake
VGGAPAAAGPESRLLAVLDEEPRGLETLARLSQVTVEQALPALLHLEWAGAAEARPGQRWARSTGPRA